MTVQEEKVMAELEVDLKSAQAILALFEAEGFTTLDAAILWAKDVLDSTAADVVEDIRFDMQDIFGDKDGKSVKPGYHIIGSQKKEAA